MSDVNLLIVVDGIFNFGPQIVTAGSPDLRDDFFSISKLIDILQTSTSPTISLTRANRNADPAADIQNFDFATSIADLSVFDEIWMIGDEGTNIDIELTYTTPGPLTFIGDDEIAAIANFMQAGGGVLATGDHDGLGSIMCGLLPRVRSMRAWFSPLDTDSRIPAGAPRNWQPTGAGRADTLQLAADNTWFFDNQSDDIPQPLGFPNGTSHPVLQGAAGPLRGFPDHMHEGQVILPWRYTDPLTPTDSRAEYPIVAGHQEKPVILATGATISGHITPTDGSTCEQDNFKNEKVATQTPGFQIQTLCAYDGHTVGVGRVVTDSSFHHYLDLNLIGDPCAPTGVKQQGFTTAKGKPIIDDMTAWYRNTAAWLKRVVKSCTLLIQNSTFGKDQLTALGLPANFPAAFYVVMDGFLPSELGIDATGHLTGTPPTVSFTVDPPASANAAVVAALVANKQLQIQPFAGLIMTEALPPAPNTPQRFLFPFTVTFTGTDGFVLPTETLTLTATITVGTTPYSHSAPLELTTSANPYLIDVDAKNDYTSWLSTDLRVFTVDDDVKLFGHKVEDFYPPGTSSTPVPAAAASTAATTYISTVIKELTAGLGSAGGNSFDNTLSELEEATISRLEFLQVNPRSKRPAFNFAICRVRLVGTTPTGPGTTQATNCRVFFRAFQAANTVSTYDTTTTYRETPIVPGFGRRVPLAGVQDDAQGKAEYVTLPFFAVNRINLAGPADLTMQPADAPNVQTLVPITGKEVDTYFGVWLDMNQLTPLFPQFAPPGDFDNVLGSFGKPGFAVQSINTAFNRAPHQCLIAEIAFDDVPIPPSADTATSDKLAQRNLGYIDGPNPGAIASRRMPHPVQVRATPGTASGPDELMIAWGSTPAASTAALFLPGVAASEIIRLADGLYPGHPLTLLDAHTVGMPVGPVGFVPLPTAPGLSAGLLAGLLTVDLPAGIRRGERYSIVVRQVTDASAKLVSGRGVIAVTGATKSPDILAWRRVAGAFQIDIAISTKQALLPEEEHLYALFRSIADTTERESRWYPVMQRYADQIAGRVAGFGGDPGKIPPSPAGNVPGLPGGGHGTPPVTGPGHPPGHGGPGGEHDAVTGKIEEIAFDRFGDFEGFLLLPRHGPPHRFHSTAPHVLDLVRQAMHERSWLTVFHEPGHPDRPLSIILRAGPPEWA